MGAAETCYTTQAAKDTCRLIKHLLSSSSWSTDDTNNNDENKRTAMALVATKRYYFGVGGGSQAFLDAIQEINENKNDDDDSSTILHVQTVKVVDNGRQNIREIFRVTKQRT